MVTIYRPRNVVDALRELVHVGAVHDERRHDDLFRLGDERSIAAHGLRHPLDRLIAELVRLLDDRRMNGACLDSGERLVGLVERDDPDLADLAGLADGVQDGGAVVAPQPDQRP